MIHNKIHRSIAVVLLCLGSFSCDTLQQTNTVASDTLAKPVEAAPAANTYNWTQPGYKQWSFKNMDKLFATSTIAKGGPTVELDKQLVSFDHLRLEQDDGSSLPYREHLIANRTDGLVVLHQGKIIAEEYFGNMQETGYHNWFSMTKSFTALIVGILAAEGKIDLHKATLDYLPWLKGSAWEGTTVQTLMDMTVGIQFDEDYHDPESDLYQFGRAARFVEFEDLPSKFNSVPEYLATVQKEGNHEEVFHYVSLNTEVLGLIITEVTGQAPSQVMSEKIWSKLGAEQDAYIAQDPNGLQLVSAAVNSTLRDAARFGQMLLDDGAYNGRQIVPEAFVATVKQGGNPVTFAPSKRGKQFPGFSYKNQFWHTDGPAFFAKGLFGQWLYIHPQLDIVIAKYSTTDIPSPAWTNDIRLMWAICDQVKSMN